MFVRLCAAVWYFPYARMFIGCIAGSRVRLQSTTLTSSAVAVLWSRARDESEVQEDHLKYYILLNDL